MVIAAWFAAAGRQGWARFYAVSVPTTFAALTGVGLMIGGNPLALPFLMTPWIFVTVLAAHLFAAGRSQHRRVATTHALA